MIKYALVLELEDMLRLERSAVRCAGASPVKGTIQYITICDYHM